MDSSDAPKQILTPEEARNVTTKGIANIIRQITLGKPPTSAQLRIINSFMDAGGPGAAGDAWVSSYAALGKIVGLHHKSFPRIIRDYKDDRLLPKPRQNGQHSVSAWRRFLEAHPEIKCKSTSVEATAPGAGKATKSDLEWEKLFQQCRKIKHEQDVREGIYIPVAKAIEIIGSVADRQKQMLRSTLEDQLPPLIEGRPAAAIRVEMKMACDRVCELFQDGINQVIACAPK